MPKPLIAVDIDDVLSSHATDMVAYSNQRWETNLTVEDYNEHWGEMWQLDHPEAEARAQEYHASGYIRQYGHDDEALPVLQQLKSRFDLVIVTSRRRVIMEDTQYWLAKHFAGIFQSVHFAGLWDNGVTDTAASATKADLCQKLGARYLIDDQLKHCEAVAAIGMEALLFGDYSWNQSARLPAGVVRTVTWQDVLAYFEER